ncbi:hypothetical protein C8R45DRAFT_292539 [Mycena sanguinolenta]|nr:hypothetical protein C8R45DRAFT_292539 [Mycena sanguinolenta]
MLAFSIIFAASFSILVAAQALLDELQLPTSDRACPICSPALANAFNGEDPSVQCTAEFAGDFFNCLICSSQSGTLLPPALGLPNIRGVSDDFIGRCQVRGFAVEINIDGNGVVSVQAGDGSSSPAGNPSSSGDPDSPSSSSSTDDSNEVSSDDSSPSSTSSSDPAPASTNKNGGRRVRSGAGTVVPIVLGAALFALM